MKPTFNSCLASLVARFATLATLATTGGCGGDDQCGPDDAPAQGLSIAIGDQTLTFGDATSSPNNDCSIDGAPTSLTIDIFQISPTPTTRRALTLCIPRPDRLLDGRVVLTEDDVTTGIQLIDLFADESGCLLSFNRGEGVSASGQFNGVCDDGASPEGYSLELSGSIPVTRNCQGNEESLSVQLSGRFAVTALQL